MTTEQRFLMNNYGWFNGVTDLPIVGSVPDAPPENPSGGEWGDPVVGELYPYWVGHGEMKWGLKPYELPSDGTSPPEHVDPEFGKWFSWSDFQRLFPLDTRAAIFTSADGLVIAFVKLIESTGGCYIAHPETIAGIDYLVTASILTEEQGAAIKNGEAITVT